MRIRILIACMIMFGLTALSRRWVIPDAIMPSVERVQAAQEPVQTSLYFPLVRVPGPTGFFRSGQTFITWPEDTQVQGEVYKIYRLDQPITPETFPNAKLLAQVGKNSAVFYANRYEYDNIWKIRYVNRLIIDDGGPQIPANWGLLVWTLNAEDFNGGDHGDGYYTVTETLPGGQEIFTPTATFGPVPESIADPAPVEITSSKGVSIGAGGHVYIQYMDLRNWNPTFHAPNYSNRYWGEDPNDPNFPNDLQYAYDYDLYTPTPDLCPGGKLPDKLPVFMYLHGWKGNEKGGEGDYPEHYCAYGIYPFDDTDTWWFGFSKDNDYRKGQNPSSGIIVNYTEYRLLRMISDLERNPPGPAVDQNRIYVAGESMGGTGSLALGEHFPNVFAAVFASQPLTNFRTAGVTRQDWLADAAVKFGPDRDANGQNLNLPIQLIAPNGWADHLQQKNGMGVYDWMTLQSNSNILTSDETAIIGINFGTNDEVLKFSTQGAPTIDALNMGKRPWAGMINDAKHMWQYFNGLPPTASKRTDSIFGTPFWGLTVVKDETVPGFSGLTTNNTMPPPTNLNLGEGQIWNYNQTIMWSSSWDPWAGAPTDEPAKWQMSFCAIRVGTWTCGTAYNPESVDITLRRVQHFQINPGACFHWENAGGALGQGNVLADQTGVLTIPGVYISKTGNALTVTPTSLSSCH